MSKLHSFKFHLKRWIAIFYIVMMVIGTTLSLSATFAEGGIFTLALLYILYFDAMAFHLIPMMDRQSLGKEAEKRDGKPFKVWAPGNYSQRVKSYGYWYQDNGEAEYYLVWVRKSTRDGYTFLKDLYIIKKDSKTLEDDVLNLAATSTIAAKEFISELESDERHAYYKAIISDDCIKSIKEVKELVENCSQQ
jgi:hypothetical protein